MGCDRIRQLPGFELEHVTCDYFAPIYESSLMESPSENDHADGKAAHAADILALGRAVLDVIGRALRSAPEIRENRLMSRWPLNLEDVLMELELEPMSTEMSIADLSTRLGASTAQLRSTALRLQRMSLVKVSPEGVSLTPLGRQRLAYLEMARAAVLRRIAEGLDTLSDDESKRVIELLRTLIDRVDAVVDEQLGL